MKKLILITAIILLALTGCIELDGSYSDTQATLEVGDKLASSQQTPTDIEYSIERYNLIRRAYWVNGQREKAMSLPSPVVLPLGYIILFSGNTVVAQLSVEGKVSSLQNYLTPISEYYEYGGASHNDWLADTDGTFGDNPAGIFFFDENGYYHEWTGVYWYSDMPFFIEDPVVKVEISN